MVIEIDCKICGDRLRTTGNVDRILAFDREHTAMHAATAAQPRVQSCGEAHPQHDVYHPDGHPEEPDAAP